MFDLEEIDAAIAELDAEYLAGEGAAHSQPWLAITRGCAALARGEVAATTPTLQTSTIDHRIRSGPVSCGRTSTKPRRIRCKPDLRRGHSPDNGSWGGHHPYRDRDLTGWPQGRVARWSTSLRSKATCSTAMRSSTRQTSTPRSRSSRSCSRSAAAGKHGKPSARALPVALRGRPLGRHGGDTGRRIFERRSPSGGGRGSPTWPRRPDRGHAGDRRPVVTNMTSTVIATRGDASSSSVSASRTGSRARGISHRGALHRRDRRRRADRRGRRVRHRRHRGRLRGARRPIPRRRSRRPRAHVVGDHGWTRRSQSGRIALQPHRTA